MDCVDLDLNSFVEVFQHLGVEIAVHYQDERVDDVSRELQEDLVSIFTVFVVKNNGKQLAEKRRRNRETEEEEHICNTQVKCPKTINQSSNRKSNSISSVSLE